MEARSSEPDLLSIGADTMQRETADAVGKAESRMLAYLRDKDAGLAAMEQSLREQDLEQRTRIEMKLELKTKHEEALRERALADKSAQEQLRAEHEEQRRLLKARHATQSEGLLAEQQAALKGAERTLS